MKAICSSLVLAWVFSANVQAQTDELIGTWEPLNEDEEVFLPVLQIEADGGFSATIEWRPGPLPFDSEFLQPGDAELPPDLVAALDSLFAEDPSLHLLTEVELSIVYTGTWQVSDDTLRAEGIAAEVKVNGLDVDLFIDQVQDLVPRMIAALSLLIDVELTEEEQQAFEQEFGENLRSGLIGDLALDNEAVTFEGIYSVEGDILTITDIDGIALEFRRLSTSSAVESFDLGTGEVRLAGDATPQVKGEAANRIGTLPNHAGDGRVRGADAPGWRLDPGGPGSPAPPGGENLPASHRRRPGGQAAGQG